MRIFAILLSLDQTFPSKLQRLVEIKPMKKIMGMERWTNLDQTGQNRAEIRFLAIFDHFLKFVSLVFLKIAQDDSLEQCLTTSFIKKIGCLNLGPASLNQTQNEVFCHFVDFGSYFFLDIKYNHILRQFLTSSGGKIHEKNLEGPNLDQTRQNRAQN